MNQTPSRGSRRLLALACAFALAGCGNSSAPGASLSQSAVPVAGGGTSGPAAPAPLPARCVPGAGLVPTVVGPLASDPAGSASHNYAFLATDVDLAAHGYVEEEYLICGTAPTQAGDYTTRLIVRRPAATRDFSGTVFAEWQNISSGYELDILWSQSYEQLMRRGHAYVGVSAQRAGYYVAPYGLSSFGPARYAQLHWPGGADASYFVADPAAYDIYTQALQALRARLGADPLQGLPVKHVVATGGSQSAGTLAIYYEEQQPLFRAADAFMPFILTTASAQAADTGVAFPVQAEVVGTPFFLVNSETDLDLTHKPDTALYRQWEVAGATHYDENAFDYNRPLVLRDLAFDIVDGDAACIGQRRSRIPFRYVLDAAIDLTVRWLETGAAPPSQPRFQYGVDGTPQRDARGNIVGGIELPQQAVPVAVNRRGAASDASFCYLYGSYAPFDAATLRSLYPTHADYVAQFDRASDEAVAAGVLGPEDAVLGRAVAATATVPP